MLDIDKNRHPAIQAYRHLFDHDHIADERLKVIVQTCGALAQDMINRIRDNSELAHGLRQLVRAKDDFTRAMVDNLREDGSPAAPNQPDPALIRDRMHS